MIKTFIKWNQGNPQIGFRILRKDKNSKSVLKLLQKALVVGKLTASLPPPNVPSNEIVLILDTNIKTQETPNEEN